MAKTKETQKQRVDKLRVTAFSGSQASLTYVSVPNRSSTWSRSFLSLLTAFTAK